MPLCKSGRGKALAKKTSCQPVDSYFLEKFIEKLHVHAQSNLDYSDPWVYLLKELHHG